MAAAEDLISSVIDEAAIDKQFARLDNKLAGLATQLKNFNIPTGGASSLKELTAQSNAYAASLTGITASTKKVLDSEKLAAIERKKIADERTQQAKLEAADLKLQQIEIKKKAIAEKEAAAISKQAAADATAAGREKIQLLKEEAAAADKAAEAEKRRGAAEAQAVTGNYNPGGGKANTAPATPPLKLTVDQGNIALVKSYENEIKKLTLEQKLSYEAFKKGEISQSAYKQQVILASEKIANYKKNIKDLNTEMRLSAAVTDQERNSLGRAQALIAQYTDQKKKLNLATADGRKLNESYNKAIEKTNAFILKNADAETIRTKTVGQYGNAITKVFGGIRTLANILPGVGLSGLFLLGYEAIKKAVEALGIFNQRLSDSKRQSELLTDINKKQAENAGSEVARLQSLYAVATNVTLSIKERKLAVDELQKQYPEHFKNIKDEIILQGGATDAYKAATAAVLEKAKATAIESKLTELATRELEVTQARRLAIRQKEIALEKKADIDKRKTTDKEGKGIDQFFAIDKVVGQNKDIDEANKDLAEIAKDREFLLSLITTAGVTPTTKTGAVTKESTKALLDSDFEIYKIAQTRKIKLLEDGVNDESKTFAERIALLQQFSKESLILNRAQEINDKVTLQRQLSAQESNLKKVKGTERNNLLTEIANTRTKIRILEAKQFDERLKIFDSNEKKYLEVEESALAQEERLRREAYERELKAAESNAGEIRAALTRQFETRLQVLNENYTNGNLSQKDFLKQREELEFDFHTQSIRNELEYAKKILDIQRAAGIDTSKQQEAVAKLAADLEAIIAKKNISDRDKQLAEEEAFLKKRAALYSELYAEITQTIKQFLLDDLEREEQNLDEKKRLLDEATQRKITGINQLGLSEVERIKQIALVEKNAQFQTEQIEKRKRALAVDRARFEKAASIASIIQKTAEAIVSNLKIVPGGITFAALVGAIGALQLARAISTPLPKYFKGTDSAKKGDGIYGEIGRELVIPTSGQPYLSPAVATLTSFVGGEKIIPADMTAQLLNATGLQRLAGMNPTQKITADSINGHLMNGMFRELKDINRKSRIIINNQSGIETSAWYDKHIKN